MYTNQLTNEVISQVEGLQLYQKYAPLQVFPRFLRRFVNFTNLCFPEKPLVAAASRCKVLKIFISIKVAVYMQSHILRSEKT